MPSGRLEIAAAWVNDERWPCKRPPFFVPVTPVLIPLIYSVTHAEFDARERPSDRTERTNYDLFLTNLCDLLGIPRPDATTTRPYPTELAHQMQTVRAVVAQAAPALRSPS